jgi:hypothetical protein
MQSKGKIECTTCEFLVEGICTNHKGIHGRGWEPVATNREKTCWSMSMNYFMNIVSQLPEYEQQLIRYNESITVDDLLHRIHAGYWKPQILRKAKTVSNMTDSDVYMDLKMYI